MLKRKRGNGNPQQKIIPSISLSPLERNDLPLLLRWINDREQALLNAPYKPVAETQHNEWFDMTQKRGDVVLFGIRLGQTNRLIGSCQLHSINYIHRSAELQIRIGDVSVRGNGYGAEAVRQLLNFAFSDLNLHRVCLHVLRGNIRALRVYEKVGFRREGLLVEAAHIDGKYEDVLVMGLLRNEYIRR